MSSDPIPLRLTATAQSVAVSRAWIRRRATRLGAHEDTVETAALLTSELVTNSVRHCPQGGGIAVDAYRTRAGRLRVRVSDDGAAMPEVRTPAPDDVGGRGLVLVEALTAAWGVEPRTGGGKAVWFLLPLADHA